MLNNDEKIQLVKTLDLNSIRKSNNPNAFKIIKSLGINMNNINNINNVPNNPNNQNNQMMLPLSLNSHLNNNNNNLNTNFMNFDFGFKNGKYN